jgi:SAM-dependent methyltransferase
MAGGRLVANWSPTLARALGAPTTTDVIRDAARGRLPARYGLGPADRELKERIARSMRPGAEVLDFGSGAKPTIPPAERPEDVRYVGLDISAAELERGAPGSYDEHVVGDITEHAPALDGRFDLAISLMVLEHVRPLDAAFENLRRYLRPGGEMVVQFAGGRAPQSLANRAVPHRLAVWALGRLNDRPPESVFPAHYDRCVASKLEPMFATGWDSVEILPLYLGAYYAKFSRFAQAAYLLYEEPAFRRRLRDWATYYVVYARRAGAAPG